MEPITTQNASRLRQPILIGIVAVLSVIAVGIIAAYATGMTQPRIAQAFDPAPPCCSEPVPIEIPTFDPPPTFDPAPPCCTDTPPDDLPTFDPAPPCCTEAPPEVPPTFDPAPPCCTETPPEIPVIPVTPEEPPPPPPPCITGCEPPPVLEEVSRCVFLTASPPVITAPGQAVVLTWKYENAPSITIAGVGTFTTPTGSVTVNPTGTTTYTATVPGAPSNPDCQKTVTLQPTTSSDLRCVFLTADKTVIDRGEEVTLSWKTENATSITIDNGVGSVTPVTQGTVKVNPNSDTTYTATVKDATRTVTCQASVRIETGGGGCTSGCGGGGGGGRSRPRVIFDSVSRPAEPPLASVYLSEIPYTGLELGPVGTAVYWTMLVIWSGAAAYLVLFGGMPVLRRKLATFGTSVRETLNSSEPVHPEPNTYVEAVSAHDAIHSAAVAHAMPQVSAPAARPSPAFAPSSARMSGEGFKAFASSDALTIDDIVKGLSRESGMQFSAEPVSADLPHVEEAPEAPHAYVPTEAPVRAPEARKEAAPVHPEVVSFIASILEGERDAVFSAIRRINQAGHDVEEFVAHAILALDDAYRARIDGTPVHEDVERATAHCATPFLERLVSSLTTAVDGSYSTGVTGIKLALTRALAVSQG